MKSKSKSLAMISLVIMAAGFILTILLPETLLTAILHGGFEAGLVGGLADWFAVTALFRHPLGLPIPHTALLPKNREKLTKGIISMIENDWLSKTSVTERVKGLVTAEKIIPLVENELQSEKAKEGLSKFLIELLNHTNEEEVAKLIVKELQLYIANLNTPKILQTVLQQLLQHHYEEKGFDFLLKKVTDWIDEEENQIKIGAASLKGLTTLKLDGLMQFALHSLVNMVSDEKMGQIVSTMIVNVVENLQTEDNEFRKDILGVIQGELQSLGTNQDLILTLENWKTNWINEYDLTTEVSTHLTQLKSKWITLLQDPSTVEQIMIPMVLKWVDQVKANSSLITKFDAWIQDKVIEFIDKNHYKIGMTVKENLDKLDDQTLTVTIEDRVGRDLQWIRVNGALCGFIIGVILSFI